MKNTLRNDDVLFAVVDTLNAGFQGETKNFQEKGFVIGQKFKVTQVNMSGFSTNIKLEGQVGNFNSCFFTFEKNGIVHDIYNDPEYYSGNRGLKPKAP